MVLLLVGAAIYYFSYLQKDAVQEILRFTEGRDELISKLPLDRYWEIPEDILLGYLLNRIKFLGGPEGNELDLEHPEIFEGFTPRDWEVLRKNKRQIVPVLLGRLKNFDNSAALILGYLKAKEALPMLRRAFIYDSYFYGWEGSKETDENNYTHHYCYEEAIEYITGKPIEKYIKLTKEEIRDLRNRKAKGEEAAAYVLFRLAGIKW